MPTVAGVCCAMVVSAVMLAGCGSAEEATTNSEQSVERLEARVEAAERKADDAKAKADAAATEAKEEVAAAVPDPTEAPTEDASEPAEDDTQSSSSGSDCVKVPNVVGKDHQLAQDTMQAAGLYMLAEQDASGQDRMLLLDRNWTTTRQRPKAGKCVSEDTEIMLYAVKDEER